MPTIDAEPQSSLSSNAYQALAPGDSYEPLVPTEARLPEVTLRSVQWGILLCVVFTGAAAYSA